MTKPTGRPPGRPRKIQPTRPTKAPPRRGFKSPIKAEAKRKEWASKTPEERAAWVASITKATHRRVKDGNHNFRYGIPNGMRRNEAEGAWYFARMYAREVTKIMKDENLLPEDPKVEQAFMAAVEVLQSPMSQAIKLQAARLILDFCKAKPVAKSEVTVKSAEDWLSAVTADHIKKTEDGPSD